MNPSGFQQAIFDAVRQTNDSLIIDAVAGSGKTTTTIYSSTLIDESNSILFLAFNKSIAEELKSRIPHHATALTFNSLGHKAVYSSLGRVSLDTNKTRRIIKSILSQEDVVKYGDDIKKMIGLAKAYCISPEGYAGSQDSDKNFEWLINRFGVDVHGEEVEYFISLVRQVLLCSLKLQGSIDYDDQLYFAVVLNLMMRRYDVIFVDEGQDVSPVQLAMLQKSLAVGGRLIAVGDEFQSIYGFRGSDSESLRKIKKRFNCKRLPLSITYRCAKNIVLYANQYVKEIQAFEKAPDGLVCSWIKYKADDFREDDLMMCRNTAPLISMAFSMIARRVSVKVLGWDIGAKLIRLIEQLKPQGLFGKNGLAEKLTEWKDYECKKLIEDGQQDKVESIIDRHDSIIAFLDNTLANSIDRLKLEINALFDNDQECLTLATVHKSKGLEAPRAFILEPGLMPSIYAKQQWAKDQEQNLIYVAVTRAKTELIFY